MKQIYGFFVNAWIECFQQLEFADNARILILPAPNSMPEYAYQTDMLQHFAVQVTQELQKHSLFFGEHLDETPGERVIVRKVPVPSSHTQAERLTVEDHFSSMAYDWAFPDYLSRYTDIILIDDILTQGTQLSSMGGILRWLGFAGRILPIVLGRTVP